MDEFGSAKGAFSVFDRDGSNTLTFQDPVGWERDEGVWGRKTAPAFCYFYEYVPDKVLQEVQDPQ